MAKEQNLFDGINVAGKTPLYQTLPEPRNMPGVNVEKE